jgi:hypothetical protein
MIHLAESLIDSAETQLYELKRLGHNAPDSYLYGQYVYWKNYRSAMRDIIRIAKSRMGKRDGDI